MTSPTSSMCYSLKSSCFFFYVKANVLFRSQTKWSVSSYPVYHSVHDTFHWMKYFVDRDFEYHRAVAQLWLQIGLTLADQPLLPFNCSQYADRLTYYAKDINDKYEKALTQQNISLGKSRSFCCVVCRMNFVKIYIIQYFCIMQTNSDDFRALSSRNFRKLRITSRRNFAENLTEFR